MLLITVYAAGKPASVRWATIAHACLRTVEVRGVFCQPRSANTHTNPPSVFFDWWSAILGIVLVILDMCAFGYTMQYQQTVKTEWMVKKGVLEWACSQHAETIPVNANTGSDDGGAGLRLRVTQGSGY